MKEMNLRALRLNNIKKKYNRLIIKRNSLTIVKLICIIAPLYGEVLIFYMAMWNCAWPVNENWDITLGTPYHIALIADPQIIDEYSYGRHGILQWFSEFFPDFYMQKNWKILRRQLRPDAIFMLGDLMDGGREWDDNKWSKESDRYRQLFAQNDLVNTPIYYLAGNHDIGFGNKIVPMAYTRFRKLYGKTNYIVSLGNHTIVTVDTVTLSGDDEVLKTEATNLIKSLSKEESKLPRILMTHVPLYRPPQTDCGPLRQTTRYITQGAGYQYQNLVEESLTRFILEGVKPKLVFSGDDHDYCEVQHPIEKYNNATEVTVNSFSFAMGVPKPGFVLLTLYNPIESIQSKEATPTFSYSQRINTIHLPVTQQFRRKRPGILQNSMFWKVFLRQLGWVVVWGFATFLVCCMWWSV
ncbi:14456_t:CDS:2 [Ambispora leptoticha]|uniref:14456_t:CDS:1 n=1 Tax=Ambispora leptoticha TaxID=144679 RepID=A0A9N8ZTR8_9GLOM|nr:14456_t:CDS:2 [Ambispora leptoticha]